MTDTVRFAIKNLDTGEWFGGTRGWRSFGSFDRVELYLKKGPATAELNFLNSDKNWKANGGNLQVVPITIQEPQ
jgi:hypothetical protein